MARAIAQSCTAPLHGKAAFTKKQPPIPGRREHYARNIALGAIAAGIFWRCHFQFCLQGCEERRDLKFSASLLYRDTRTCERRHSSPPSDDKSVYMAGLRRAQEIDQWRPEESPARDRDRERVHDRIVEPDASSPVPRTARDSRRGDTHETDTRPSTRHARGRSHERSLSRERTRRRSRGGSRESHRPTRRTPSADDDRVTHTHRHHHSHRHRESTPPTKRQRSRSTSAHSHKRSRRHRSRSSVRSRSRTRRAETTHRPAGRAFSPRSDRDRTRRSTPEFDTYKPIASSRRRSPSADSQYRQALNRGRKRSPTPERKSRREGSRRRDSPRRHHRRHHSPTEDTGDRRHTHGSAKGRHRSRSRSPTHARARSSRRRRSSTPTRRSSPHKSHREREHIRDSRSPRGPHRRLSKSPPKAAEFSSNRASRPASRKNSPPPNSDDEGDSTMRGGAYYQGRGGQQHSYSPPYSHQYPSQSHPSGRGGWSGQQSYANQG